MAASPAQTFTVLKVFDGTNGSYPFGSLVEGVDANLYGTTYGGGADLGGTVFKFTLRGGIDPLYSFCVSTGCPDGNGPMAGLLLGFSDDFYGVTETGGMNTNGALFQISPEGTLSTLYSFCALANCADGGTPVGGLIESPIDSKFYGDDLRIWGERRRWHHLPVHILRWPADYAPQLLWRSRMHRRRLPPRRIGARDRR